MVIAAAASAQPDSGPRSIQNLPAGEQQMYIQEFEMMVWNRVGEPPLWARPEALGPPAGAEGFWFFDNCLAQYYMNQLRDQEENAPCPQGIGHMDCNGGCSTGLSRGYSEMDIMWRRLRNGFGSHGETNGGAEYTCAIQGINREPWACDAPCTYVEFEMSGAAELWSSRFYHPQQLDDIISAWNQYTDQLYSTPYYGAYKRFHEQRYKPLVPKIGWYDGIESEWWYTEALGDFMQNEPRKLIGSDGSTMSLKSSAWLKRGNVGLQYANRSLPTGPAMVLDPHVDRYIQLCNWVVAFDNWLAPQPAPGTDAYNDIFDIWYATRFYPWYDDAGAVPVEPTTWGSIKASYR